MKAFIFAAGYGTRNLPATKSVPKELFPVYDKTAMDFILDECEEAGITDLVILTSRRKKALDDYFDREPELESVLQYSGKDAELELVRRASKFNTTYIRQQEMKGTGHALLTAYPVLKGETFLAFFPDDIVLGGKGGAAQVLEIHQKTGLSVLGAREELHNPSAYGVIEYTDKDGVSYVDRIVEKPAPNEVKSNLVSVGRFVYTPEFMYALQKDYQNHKTGEFYPMGAMMSLAQQQKLVVQKLNGKILDTGNHNSYLNTILEYADSTPEGRKVIDAFLQSRK